MPTKIEMPSAYTGLLDSAWAVEGSIWMHMRETALEALTKWQKGKFVRIINT